MNSNKSPLTKMLLINFHEAALWGAITIARKYKPDDVSVRDLIKDYKDELDLDDDHLPTTYGWTMYARINNKINKARNDIKGGNYKFKGELIEEVKALNEQLQGLIKALDEGNKT